MAAAPLRRVDIFSPGELSKPHAGVEGLANCTKCHPSGKQLSQDACLACHEELKPRIAGGRGFHGKLQGKERDCWTCHHEHQGRDFPQVDWGPPGVKGFDHARTGWPLEGKHAPVACEKCHDPKLIGDPAVRALMERQPGRRTYLGAPPACAACHADEHRGLVGNDCQKCHGEQEWKPARGFDHARTTYPLLGRHQKVACDKCHPSVDDLVEHVGLQPKKRAFLRMKPVHHQSCLDCHKDPHLGRFGESCQKCHTEADWKRMVDSSMRDRTFHDKTRYRLEGAHLQAQCQACHGPWPGEAALFRNVPFAACVDCHLDGHGGQFHAARGKGIEACEKCHAVQAFEAAKYGLEEHRASRYPLEGAHRSVACSACHQSDPRVGERLPAAARAELQRRGRPVKVSLAVYLVAGDLQRCETCHADAHGGQFDRRAGARGCVACHEVAAFSKTRFDHARDTKFPLEGKHARTACASCHPAERSPGGARQVKYAGVETTCAGCHADVHASQFALPRQPTDCARCHGNDDWKKPLRFVHEPPFTEYRLTGKHLRVECKACHPDARVGERVAVRRYRGVPRACQACHVDFHKGQFRGFEP
jgi:hypothetical protein